MQKNQYQNLIFMKYIFEITYPEGRSSSVLQANPLCSFRCHVHSVIHQPTLACVLQTWRLCSKKTSLYIGASVQFACCSFEFNPAGRTGNKGNMLTHTYPHKPIGIKVAICNHEADCPLLVGLMTDMVISNQRKECLKSFTTPNVLTETRYW